MLLLAFNLLYSILNSTTELMTSEHGMLKSTSQICPFPHCYPREYF